MFRKGNASGKKIADSALSPLTTTSTSNDNPAINASARTEVNTLIGTGVTVEGDIKFDGVLKVDGKIIGNLIGETDDSILILNDDGTIEGEVRVANMIINGQIDGNVFTNEKIELYPKAKITGDVHYNLLEMEVGAEVNGHMIKEQSKAQKVSSIRASSMDVEIEGMPREDIEIDTEAPR